MLEKCGIINHIKHCHALSVIHNSFPMKKKKYNSEHEEKNDDSKRRNHKLFFPIYFYIHKHLSESRMTCKLKEKNHEIEYRLPWRELVSTNIHTRSLTKHSGYIIDDVEDDGGVLNVFVKINRVIIKL